MAAVVVAATAADVTVVTEAVAVVAADTAVVVDAVVVAVEAADMAVVAEMVATEAAVVVAAEAVAKSHKVHPYLLETSHGLPPRTTSSIFSPLTARSSNSES